MLWLYTQGGWALQPSTLPTNGCVLRPPIPRSFGFGRSLLAIGVPLIALGWLWFGGHAVEVAGAVLAAVLIGAADRPLRALAPRLARLARRSKRVMGRGRR